MPQTNARRGNATRPGNGGLPGWVWFLTGLVLGIFASFLFYLWHNVPTDPNAAAIVDKPGMDISSDSRSHHIKWDFYSIFQKSNVPLIGFGKDGQKTEVNIPRHFIIQVGAFKTADQANRRRAQLILLGFEPFIKISMGKDGTAWHRVILGPLDSRLEVDRDRRKLADANIPSLTFHVPP